jgi:hypothetical protein
MQLPREAILLRIFFGENDQANHRPLHEAVVCFASVDFQVLGGGCEWRRLGRQASVIADKRRRTSFAT